MLRVMIVDDHAVVRKGLSLVLNAEPDITVVAEAGDGDSAVRLARREQPDLVLLDRMLPGMDGLAVLRALRKHARDIRVIILTGTALDADVLEILQAGVDGYLSKDVEPDELLTAIRKVAAGEAYLDPAVTRHVLNRLSTPRSQARSAVRLTPREAEIIQWMATRSTYREIAEALTISEETVRSHAKNILTKLNQPNRAQAVLAAARQGLIELTE